MARLVEDFQILPNYRRYRISLCGYMGMEDKFMPIEKYLCKRHASLISTLLPDDWCGACESERHYKEGIEEGKRIVYELLAKFVKKEGAL